MIEGGFAEHARRSPDATAVLTPTGRLSYAELKAASDRLAARIARRLGPAGGPEPVAICTDRLPDVLVAMLAVLSSGRAYTVVPPALPGQDRLAQLAACHATAVITYRRLLPHLDDGRGRPAILLDADDAVPAQGSGPGSAAAGETDPADAVPVSAGDVATVLVTSGATGDPRNVPATHGRWLAALDAWDSLYGLTPDDHVLVTAPPETTAFTAGWLRALSAGATLEAAGRPADRAAVTVADTDPVTAARLLAVPGFSALRLLTVSGEPLRLSEHLRLQGRLPAAGARVVSLYGVAETVGCGTWFEPDQLAGPQRHPGRAAFLGMPLPGCEVTLRRGRIWLTPPDGTAPVNTGDLGRGLGELNKGGKGGKGGKGAGGLLEFRGRTADLVKIKGRTVDTYAVEAALGADAWVDAVVVTGDRTRSTGGRLLAFLVPAKGAPTLDAVAVRNALEGLVPRENVPETIVALKELPRNRAGKVDRGALPLPPQPGAAGNTGKGGDVTAADAADGVGCVLAVVVGVLSWPLTDVLWPGSTDLTGVPSPWNTLFTLLYVAEDLAFAAGVAFLFGGRSRMIARGGRGPLTTAAHLSVVWLLASWWPQDNFYRLAEKTDWARQAALVYVFNVPLMIAGAMVAAWAIRKRPLDR